MFALRILLVALQAWAIAASPVLVPRQKDTITAALGMIQTSLKSLDTSVRSLSAKDPNTAVAVLNSAQGAQSSIEQATAMIQGADNIGLFGALGLQQSATDVVDTVTTTLGSLTQKKPVFDQLGVSSVVSDALQQQKTGSTALSEALLSKVPALARPIAEQSTGQLTEALDNAIAAFKQPAAPAAGGAAAAAPPKAPAAAPAAPAA